jgi:hypothetical protein
MRCVLASGLLLTPEHIRNFWLKVARAGPDECWLWTGWRNAFGHGRFEVAGQKLLASHLALILTGQPRPPAPRDNALHGDTCVSPSCVNPAHLRWGTHKENSADRERLGRRIPRSGTTHHNAKLDPDKVRYIRSSPLNQHELARELGVSQPIIGQVRRGVTWKHVT